MRRSLSLLSLLSLLFLLALACPFPAAARTADSTAFDRYRVPDHTLRVWGGSLQGNASRGSANVPHQAGTTSSLAPSATGDYFRLRDGEARQWQVSLGATVQGERDHAKTRADYPDAMFELEESGASGHEVASAQVGWREYPGRRPIGLDLTLSGRLDDLQAWDHTGEHDRFTPGGSLYLEAWTADSRAEHDYRTDATAGAGVGIGRVRDASAVHTVWILEQRWRADGALTRPLSDGARTRLAQLFSVRGEFSGVHDMPDKAFWGDVETILREDGALAGDRLGAWATRHGDDSIDHGFGLGTVRYTGAYAGPRFRYTGYWNTSRIEHSSSALMRTTGGDTWDETRSSSSQRTATERPLAGLEGEWHRALGMQTHVDAHGAAYVDARGIRRASQVTASAEIRHWMGERWMAGAVLSDVRVLQRDTSPIDGWAAALNAALTYYIEDHWSLQLTGNASRLFIRTPYEQSQRNMGLVIGFGYNRGALDAPGLFAPERPLH